MGQHCSHDSEPSIQAQARKLRCETRRHGNEGRPSGRAPLLSIASHEARRMGVDNPLAINRVNTSEGNSPAGAELEDPTLRIDRIKVAQPRHVSSAEGTSMLLPQEVSRDAPVASPPVEYTFEALQFVGSNCSSRPHPSEESGGKSGSSGGQLADFYSVSQLGNELAKSSLAADSSVLDLQGALAAARKGQPPRPLRTSASHGMSPKSTIPSYQRCGRPLSISSEVASNSLSARSLPCFEAPPA